MENNILHGVYLQELLGRNHGKKRNISFHGVYLQVSPGGNRGKKRNYISPWCFSIDSAKCSQSLASKSCIDKKEAENTAS